MKRDFDGHQTRLQREVATHRDKGTLQLALGNFSRTPGGQKRTVPPRNSIWPEGKTAKPGRELRHNG